MIISSSFSTETEGILFIVSLSEWGGRPGVRRGRVGGSDVALECWNDFQFLKPSMPLSYSNPIKGSWQKNTLLILIYSLSRMKYVNPHKF